MNTKGCASRALSILVFSALMLVPGARALAQGYVVVTADATPMRCGDRDLRYAVAELKPGTILRVESEAGGWKRVRYPEGTPAIVYASEVTVVGNEATLAKPTRLRAFNAKEGIGASWQPLFDKPLPIGTKLAIIEPTQSRDGRYSGFKVKAPAESFGFVHERGVRVASEDEVKAFLAMPEGSMADENDQDKPAEPAPAEPTASQRTIDLRDPATAPPVGGTVGAAEPTQPAEPAAPRLPRYEELDAAYRQTMKSPLLDAEFDTLIAEIQRVQEAQDDTNVGRSVRQKLQARIDLLKLRQDVQAASRLQADRAAEVDAGRERLAGLMAEYEKSKRYQVVGRLTASTVYDGKNLPLMYRVVSVGGSFARTVGYLKPDPALELDSKLGRVVGVVGEAAYDEGLKVSILTALRVDTLASDEPQNP